jgi:2-(1,2-epoxy-1,2-dihydrophenyl)acetyl-CoA isomerase
MTKKLLNDGLGSSLDQALENEGMAQTVNFGTSDTAEAMLAFIEKRDPTFHGK